MNKYQLFIEELNSHLIPCYFKSATSIDCPACGLQTATILLLKGDIVGSIMSHPSLLPLMISFIVYAVNYWKPNKTMEKLFMFNLLTGLGLMIINYAYKWYMLEVF